MITCLSRGCYTSKIQSIEISSLLYHFLLSSGEDCIIVKILGKRKCEVGLLVSVTWGAFNKSKQTTVVTFQTKKVICILFRIDAPRKEFLSFVSCSLPVQKWLSKTYFLYNNKSNNNNDLRISDLQTLTLAITDT